MIKASTTDPVLLAGLRQLGAVLVLLPVYIRQLRKHNLTFSLQLVLPSVIPGLLLAAHFATWNIAVRLTLAANASLIVNSVPVAMPFLALALNRERITAREVFGTLAAMGGIAVLSFGEVQLSREHANGDLIAFLSMLFLATYMALARRNNRLPSIWLYVVPLYAVGGIADVAASLVISGTPQIGTVPLDAAFVALLVFVPTIVGHSTINHSMRILPSQVVSLSMLLQPLFAAIPAFFLFQEVPRPTFYIAAVLIIVGVVSSVLRKRQAEPVSTTTR